MVVVALAAAAAGCFPLLAHPTHVEEGVTIAASMGVHVLSTQRPVPEAEHPPIAPGFTLSAAAGVREPEQGAAALRVAGGMNVTALAPVLDVYVEVPDAAFGTLDAGLGVAGQFRVNTALLPYAQLGRRYSGGRLWFVSNAIGVVRFHSQPAHSLVWLPTVAFGVRRERRTWMAYATAVVGGRPADCEAGCLYLAPGQRTVFIVGMSTERGVDLDWRRPRPGRLPPRRPPGRPDGARR